MANRKQPELQPTRRSDSSEAQGEDLSEQIAGIREMMAWILSMASEEDDPKILAGLLDKYSQASTRLASLLKAQRALAGEKDLPQALQQIIADVLESESFEGP